jgi:type III restriction enzyme
LDNIENNGSEIYKLRGHFNPQDLVEDLSEKTGLCYLSVMKILRGINNASEYIKNPPVYIEQAAFKIRQVQLDELVRCAEYTPTGGSYEFNFEDFTKDGCENYIDTPNHGLWDKTLYDSGYEKEFARKADSTTNTDVLCFLKFPTWYKIPTPIGNYEPDFGVVLHKKQLLGNGEDKEYYFVVEIKGTEDLTDIRALTPHEKARIEFAVKHFRSLGIESYYKAPIKEYETFEAQAKQTINS